MITCFMGGTAVSIMIPKFINLSFLLATKNRKHTHNALNFTILDPKSKVSDDFALRYLVLLTSEAIVYSTLLPIHYKKQARRSTFIVNPSESVSCSWRNILYGGYEDPPSCSTTLIRVIHHGCLRVVPMDERFLRRLAFPTRHLQQHSSHRQKQLLLP